jgi:hypothetical protein
VGYAEAAEQAGVDVATGLRWRRVAAGVDVAGPVR